MLLNKEQVEKIKERKVTYVKDFVFLERNYDFNLLSNFMEENECIINQKSNVGNLKDVFQIVKVSNTLQVGNTHVDIEDVFIIGLKGTTIYRVFDKINIDYEINKGDMIFIPYGTKHKVIGITPRIIASIGFFDRKL